MKSITYNTRAALAALAVSLLFSLGTVHADNRFGDGVGGAMGGTGSFGEGSVTIHHNLLPEERSELDGEIADIRAMIMQQAATIEDLRKNTPKVGALTCGSQKLGTTTSRCVIQNRREDRVLTYCRLAYENGLLYAKQEVTTQRNGCYTPPTCDACGHN